MRFKFLALVLAIPVIFMACGGRSSSRTGYDTDGPIKVNFAAENRLFRYTHATPLVMPNESVIRAGDLKPFWQWVERRLNIQLDDVTSQSTANAIMQTESATGFVSANIFGGNSIATDLMNFGTQGHFIDLAPYITAEVMPNLYAYLQENPAVLQSMTAYDGGIYFIPYIAEIGNLARVFLGRQSWVRILLDGQTPLETETAALNVSYSGFWKGDNARHSSNVIVLQNEAAANGVLNFTSARNTLVNYIRDAYPGLRRPSDLFLGSGAQYDIDELAALWRVVKLAPNTLSKAARGSVTPNAEIVPFFFRLTTYREDLLRLASYFNGQRVFGSDSYASKFYFDKDGELQFSYNEDNFLFGILPHFRAFVQEGLIAPDFANISDKSNFRTIYFGGDLREGNTQFGFMTNDWIPSTTNLTLGDGLFQTDVEGFLPPLTRIPGVVEGFVHFIENTRTVKPDGWAISSITGGEKLMSIIKLFDFMFSREGSDAQNFGMPELIDPEPYVNVEGVSFPKMNIWFNEQAALFANGDGSFFSRSFIGFNHPIGYPKSIGFEQQFTSVYGENAWALHGGAEILSPSYNSDQPYFTLAPTIFSLDSRLQRQLEMTNINNTQVDLIFNYLTTGSPTLQQIREAYKNAKVDDYIEIHRKAYNMMTGKR